MIQDIAPSRLYNEYRPTARAREMDKVLSYREGGFYVRSSGEELIFPRVGELPGNPELIYLFSIDEERFFLRKEGEALPEPYFLCTMNELRDHPHTPKTAVYALMTAFHLAEWYRDNRFCGRCGGKHVIDDTERAMYCPVCQKKVYPRINPAVIIGVINGDYLLLTRYRKGYSRNALVAGFTEIGETLEETVRREVMEETGLRVKNIRYYKSQPWGMASDILMGFYCEVDGDTEIRMDESELKYAQWVKREEITLQPLGYSLTNEMMAMFKSGEIR